MRIIMAVIVGIGLLATTPSGAADETIRIQQPPPPPPPPPMRMPPARDQQAQIGKSQVRGRVTAADTGAPIRRAVVRLTGGTLQGGRVATTDAEGRYEFRDLPAGRYIVGVSKGGFVNLQYGQRRPFEPGTPLELADAQTVDRVDFALPRGGVITGRIVDEFGEPVAEASVQAMRYQFVGGRRRLTTAGRPAQTNDIGQFRIYGLSPGEYYVSGTLRSMELMAMSIIGAGAGAGSGDSTGYAPTYYPGTASASEAQRVAVAVGQEAMSIDFPLLPVRTARISGIAFDSQGRPLANAMIMLMQSQAADIISFMGGGSRVQKDGTFMLNNVAPGDYHIQIRMAPQMITAGGGGGAVVMTTVVTPEGGIGAGTGGEMEFASVPVTVSGEDIVGLTIVTSKGARMTGHVLFDGSAPPRSQWENLRVSALNVELDLAPVGGGAARVNDDGTFELKGLAGQRLIRPVALPDGWTLKSIRVGGVDVTDRPIDFRGADDVTGVEVTLSPRVTEVTGGVNDEKGEPLKDYTVIVFAADSARWGFQSRFVATGRPDQDGRFKIRGLPPEDYLAVAVDYVQAGEWQDPEFLEKIKLKGTRLTLGEGETKGVSLKLTLIQ